MKVIKELNWPYIVIALMGCGFWYSVFTNGFFVSLMGMIVITAIIVLWLRLSGRV